MPGSVAQGKQEIQEWINKQSDITTIVDVGAGGCTYPILLGDRYTFIAIEIWAPYLEQFKYEDYYSHIIVGDIRYVEMPDADCIIFGDVLEHLPKDDAWEVLKRAKQKYKHMVLSVPLSDGLHLESGEMDIRPAKPHFGNNFELHISPWGLQELTDFTKWDMIIHAGKNDMGIFCK